MNNTGTNNTGIDGTFTHFQGNGRMAQAFDLAGIGRKVGGGWPALTSIA
jgi:hypothetical protein